MDYKMKNDISKLIAELRCARFYRESDANNVIDILYKEVSNLEAQIKILSITPCWQKFDVDTKPANGSRLAIRIQGNTYMAVFTWHCGFGERWQLDNGSYFTEIDGYCIL
jgi:hypothetical protein